jgi:4-amino-4-deoxy-L-arabinose transferase-like glycosyltransferase
MSAPFKLLIAPKAWITSFIFVVLAQCFLTQTERSWTWVPGLVLLALSFWNVGKIDVSAESSRSIISTEINPKLETFIFFLIFFLGLFFRLYRMDSISLGLHPDQGLTGLFALRILHEHWRPFSAILASPVPDALLSYLLAGWFGLVGSSAYSFHFFLVLLSLGAFPFIYWTFRQLSGSRTALLSLFFLAVMRWNWVEVRNAHDGAYTPLFIFGTLSFFLLASRKGKPIFLIPAAFFCGIGLYGYQALKTVPFLVLALAVFEFRRKNREIKISRPAVLFFFLLILGMSFPLLHYIAQDGSFGQRESELFIGKKILGEKSLRPLLKVWTGTAVMFNRKGDLNPWHNLPGHRMLDDGTGILFLLGLAYAWRIRKTREGAYPLIGFFILSLPGLLSTDIAPTNRLLGLTPFVAFFAGLGGAHWGWTFLEAFQRKRKILILSAALALALVTVQNTYLYFGLQAKDPGYQEGFEPKPNQIGQAVDRLQKTAPGHFRYFVDPLYFHHPTVDFLSYGSRKDVLEFDANLWAEGSNPRDKDALIFLADGKTGVAQWLQLLFPGGREERLSNPAGRPFSFYLIPQEDLNRAKPWNRGLKGLYRNSTDWKSPQETTRIDPLLNFSSGRDFPFPNYFPFRIRWTGGLNLKLAGDYEFQVLTEDRCRFWLDGKPTAVEKPLRLSAGPHRLKLEFEKDGGYYTTLRLIWKKPGDKSWEIVPAQSFGIIR